MTEARRNGAPLRRLPRVVYFGMWFFVGPVLVVSAALFLVFVVAYLQTFAAAFLIGLVICLAATAASGGLLHCVSKGYHRADPYAGEDDRSTTSRPMGVARQRDSVVGQFHRGLRRVYSLILAHPVTTSCALFLFVPSVALGWQLYASGSVLREAAVKGDMGSVRFALALGADPNLADGIGVTPLHCAAAGGSTEVARALLQAGADIEARISDPSISFMGDRYHWDGRTPLHYAAESGRADVVKLLVGHGANANSKATNGDTPLHSAVLGSPLLVGRDPYPDVVRALLASGADPCEKDVNGNTPLDIVDHISEKHIAYLLRTAMAKRSATE